MLVYVLIGLAVVVGLFIVVVATRPSEFRVSRSATIAAPRSAVWEQVNDFHNWEAWSPWAKLDPAATNSFEGAAAGTGAIFRWAGNNQVGEGSMTLTESRPGELICITLEFLKPFKGTSTVEFRFEPDGDGTTVVWSMSGKNNFMAKAVGLFMNCEKMVGDQYDQGLANLKALVESPTAN